MSPTVPITASIIRCPLCGNPFSDVSPDYVLVPLTAADRGWAELRIFGTCLNTHPVGVTVMPGRILVEAL